MVVGRPNITYRIREYDSHVELKSTHRQTIPKGLYTDGNSQTGTLIRVLEGHQDVVTALHWLPDSSGFISGGLDRKIILWVCFGATIRLRCRY